MASPEPGAGPAGPSGPSSDLDAEADSDVDAGERYAPQAAADALRRRPTPLFSPLQPPPEWFDMEASGLAIAPAARELWQAATGWLSGADVAARRQVRNQLLVLVAQARQLQQGGDDTLAMALCHDVRQTCVARGIDPVPVLFCATAEHGDILTEALAKTGNAPMVVGLLELFHALALRPAAVAQVWAEQYVPQLEAWLFRAGAEVRRASLLHHGADQAAHKALRRLAQVAKAAGPLAALAPCRPLAVPLQHPCGYVFSTAHNDALAADVLEARGCAATRFLLLRLDTQLQQAFVHGTHAAMVEALAHGHVAQAQRCYDKLQAVLDEVPIVVAAEQRLWAPVIAAIRGVKPLKLPHPTSPQRTTRYREFGADSDCYAIDGKGAAAEIWLPFAAIFGFDLSQLTLGHHDFGEEESNARLWLCSETAAQQAGLSAPARELLLLRYALRGPFAFEVGAMWDGPLGPEAVALLQEALASCVHGDTKVEQAFVPNAAVGAANDFLEGLRCTYTAAPGGLLRLVLDPQAKQGLSAKLRPWIETGR